MSNRLPTTQHGIEPVQIGTVVADFLCDVFESERLFISVGWCDPIGLHDAAVKFRLCGDRFADERLGYIFAYLAYCAENDVVPGVEECLRVAVFHEDIPLDQFDDDWLYRLILETEVEGAKIGQYASEVSRLADIRENSARHHLKELGKLLIDEDKFEFMILNKVAQRKPTASISPYLHRRKGNHRGKL